MLSYQHGFHAGNFADVLKHAVLCQVIDYLLQKDKPLYFHDTHAGRGLYDLTHPVAQKTAEYRDGISRIWNRRDIPTGLLPYIQTLQAFNAGTGLRMYAGSSLLAQRMMRPSDRLMANELHPQEYQALGDNVKALRNLRVSREDGYAALRAALPPAERRAVVLIDPSYEVLSDDRAVVDCLRDALQRFATGTYLVWYPVVDPQRARKLVNAVTNLPVQKLLQLELYAREPLRGQGGMAGSGMLVINPPWTLEDSMREALPWLVQQLAPDTGHSQVFLLSGE